MTLNRMTFKVIQLPVYIRGQGNVNTENNTKNKLDRPSI